nr:MAG TPA: hypothetical protein [Caudoviricetes sp.]
MGNRPGQLCTLKSGKAIGAQANFADTFNWLVSAVKNLRGGKGVKVSWPADDTPEIVTDGEDGNNGGDGGGGNIDCVVDVARGDTTIDETDGYTQTDHLLVTYSTSQTKAVPLPSNNGVADVEEAPITDGKRLTVKYENARPDKNIDVPYKNEFVGTDQSYTRRDTDFSFSSASDSNVTVKCVGNVITLGVYYT